MEKGFLVIPPLKNPDSIAPSSAGSSPNVTSLYNNLSTRTVNQSPQSNNSYGSDSIIIPAPMRGNFFNSGDPLAGPSPLSQSSSPVDSAAVTIAYFERQPGIYIRANPSNAANRPNNPSPPAAKNEEDSNQDGSRSSTFEFFSGSSISNNIAPGSVTAIASDRNYPTEEHLTNPVSFLTICYNFLIGCCFSRTAKVVAIVDLDEI